MRPLTVAVTTAVALLIAPLDVAAGSSTDDGADETITVEATDFDFDPEDITVEAGTTLKIVLVNEGNVAHSWAVPELDAESERISPGNQTSVTLSPDEPGTHKIVCQVPGHEQVGMTGTLTVESSD